MAAPLHILAIEISNPGAGIRTDDAGTRSGPNVALGRAVGSNVQLIDREWLRPTPVGTRGGIDDDLMPALDRLFKRLGTPARAWLRAERASRVAVSIGPGGYTSVRIACAAGKMIAEAAGAKAVAVPTDAALARAARRDPTLIGPLAVVLAGKGDSAWARIHTSDEVHPTQPGRLITAADLPTMRIGALVADAHLPRDMRTVAEGLGLRIVEPTYDAAAVVELGALLPAIDPVELNPLYPREPDAVTLWRARGKA